MYNPSSAENIHGNDTDVYYKSNIWLAGDVFMAKLIRNYKRID